MQNISGLISVNPSQLLAHLQCAYGFAILCLSVRPSVYLSVAVYYLNVNKSCFHFYRFHMIKCRAHCFA